MKHLELGAAAASVLLPRQVQQVGEGNGDLGSGERDELWIIHSRKAQQFPPGISELLLGASYMEQSDLYLISTKRADSAEGFFYHMP